MAVEIGVLIAIISCAIGVVGFAGGRLAAANKNGREWGEIVSDIKHIKERVDEISDASTAGLEREASERKEADRRLHVRIDEHIAKFHAAK